MRKTLWVGAALFASYPISAFAQSSCPVIVPGAVLTAAQWQQCFEAKADVGTGGGSNAAVAATGDCSGSALNGVLPLTCNALGHLSQNNDWVGQNTFAAVIVARRTVTGSTTASATTDNVICGDVSGGAFTITLPPGTGSQIPNGLTIGIDDCKGKAAGSNLTVAANAGQVISGAASVILNQNYQAISAVWNSGTSSWDLF